MARQQSDQQEIRFKSRLSLAVRTLFQPIVIDDVKDWRRHFAEKILILAVLVFPVGLGITLPFFLENGFHYLIALDLLILVWMLLSLTVRRPPLTPSGIGIIVPILILALSFHLTLGPDGARPLWIMTSVALAAALYGMRGVWVTTAICTLMLGLLYTLVPPDFAPWQHALAQPLTAKLMTVVNINVLSFVVGASMAMLLNSMETQIHRANKTGEQYRLLAENASDVIWTTDMSLNFTYVSPSILELRGYTAEEAMKMPLERTLTPESVTKVRQLVAHQLELIAANDKEAWSPMTVDVEQPHRNGTTITTSNHVKFIKGPDGQAASIIGITRDVTGARQTEAQLRQAQKMEAVGRLAGGVAHDFNNMLCAIMGNTELVLDEMSPDDPMRAYIETIATATTRSAALTQQLLAFSRKQIVAPQVIDINEVVSNMQPMLVRLIGENITLNSALANIQGRIFMDPTQVEQVILNLAINARDAMPDGGKLHFETSDVILDEGYCATHLGVTAGPYVILAVSDTGQGMDTETRERLFEPFFTTKKQGKGTGLGLATVQGIVEQGGGRIEIYSEPGQGSTFKVYLPWTDEVPAPAAQTAEPALSGGDETILVVEDEEIVRNLAEKLLKRLGYRVLLASNGDEAIAVVEAHDGPIDLLLTDVVMPGMNGRELADQLTAAMPGLKVLYASGYTEDVIVHHGVLDAGVRFIPKPYTLRSIEDCVRKALEAG